MPGRPLRQARERAVEALTDEQARDLAQLAVRRIGRGHAIGIIVSALPPETPMNLRLQAASLSLARARTNVRELAARDPHIARAVISATAHHHEVEQALDIPRSQRQQRPNN